MFTYKKHEIFSRACSYHVKYEIVVTVSFMYLYFSSTGFLLDVSVVGSSPNGLN